MPVNKDALALAAQINKKIGVEALVVASALRVPRRYTSGSISIDVALGGGWPGNQWVEVIGGESHGKTAIVFKTIAANQQLDPEFTTMWLAAEHYDIDQAQALGVDNDRVLVVPTQEMEFAFATMIQFAESRSVDCVVLDSYPALIADEEAEKDMDQFVVGLGARLTGKFFRKAGKATQRSLTDDTDRPFLGIIINQWRDKIGGFSPYGPAQTTPGGKAKNYAFYIRVEVKRDEWIDETRPGKGKARVGQVIKIKTIKNKSAPPQQVATVDFYFADAPVLGFARGDYDAVKELLPLGLLYNAIIRRGRYFHIGDRRWDSKDSFIEALRGELDLQDQLREQILERSILPPALNDEAA